MSAELLHCSGVELARRIRCGEATSAHVVDVHIEQIERVNPSLNAVVRDRFAEARAEAAAADARVADGESDLPVFHGVPCSIKECFALTGMPNTAGLVSRRDHAPPSEDSTAVRRLRAAGAIPLGVTNTSELCMWMESNNHVYGRTNNPYDNERIVGGSSGGEGAIVAAAGTPFGLGSDIGGSIRLPAFFNGVFGHKPTGGLVPGSGQFPDAENAAKRYLTTGPLARNAEDLMPFLRIVAGPDGADTGCLNFDLGDPASVRVEGLKVTVIETNGFRRVHPELRAAQLRAAAALEARGAQVQTKRVKGLRRSFEIWATLMGEAEEETTFRQLLEAGTRKNMVVEALRSTRGRSAHTLPAIVLAGVERLSHLVAGSPENAIRLAAELRAELLELIGDGVLLFPPYTRPAPKHDWPLLTPLDFSYCGIFNVMEMPSTQVPLGLSQDGLPLGVQVIAKHGADHVTIGVAKALEDELGGWTPPPCVAALDPSRTEK